jgi:hypothetical protein
VYVELEKVKELVGERNGAVLRTGMKISQRKRFRGFLASGKWNILKVSVGIDYLHEMVSWGLITVVMSNMFSCFSAPN